MDSGLWKETSDIPLCKSHHCEERITQKRHGTIFRSGQDARHVYCLCGGLIKITTETASGNEVILDIVRPGSIFGIHSDLNESVHPFSATTIIPSTILTISRKVFQKMLVENDNLHTELINTLLRNTHNLNLIIASLHMPCKERLICMLIEFAKGFGKKNGSFLEVELRMTREELSNYVGMSKETLIRTMASLTKDGVITENRKVLTIDLKAAHGKHS